MSYKIPIPAIAYNLILQSVTDPKTQKYALRTLGRLLYLYYTRRKTLLDHYPLSRAYKLKLVGKSKYYKVWEILKTLNIIEYYTYSNSKHYCDGLCMKLRINPNVYDGNVRYMTCTLPSRQQDDEAYVKDNILYEIKSRYRDISLINLAAEESQLINDSLWRKYFTSKYVENDAQWSYHDQNDKLVEIELTERSIKNYFHFERTLHTHLGYKVNRENMSMDRFSISRSLNGRVNYPLTSLNSSFIKYVQVDGYSMHEIDLKNAQPLLLALLLEYNVLHPNPCPDNVFFDEYLQSFPFGGKALDTTPLLVLPKSDLCVEITLFKSLCIDGRLYEFYAQQIFQRPCTDLLRSKAKKSFITALFSNLNSSKQEVLDFAKVFPSIFSLLRSFKHNLKDFMLDRIKITPEAHMDAYLYSKTKGIKSPHQAANDYLSVRLQILESTIFIDNILKDLYTRHIWALPKHDSIFFIDSREYASIIESFSLYDYIFDLYSYSSV